MELQDIEAFWIINPTMAQRFTRAKTAGIRETSYNWKPIY